ncbi:MAG: DUF4340 domain-containing protein [Acidobacteriota bacterium]
MRSLLVLLILALGLGAYVYFVEAKRDPDAATKKDKVFTVETGKIDQVDVRAASGEVTTVKKQGDKWQVTAPISAAADQSAVTALVSTIETLEAQKTLEENPASVSAYGLEPARFSVAFKLAGDAATHRLNVGNRTPTGSDVYARVDGQPKLFLLSAYLEDSLNRTTFSLRDKTALTFPPDTTDAMTVEAPGSPVVTLSRKDNTWQLTAPAAARADYAAVDGMVSRLSQLQMKSIVSDAAPSPKDMTTYGLDKPKLLVTVGSGSSRAALAIGANKDDATVYARDVSKPMVFTVDASALADLDKKADDLRVKDVFDFKPFSAVSLDVTSGGTTTSFAKSTVPAPPAPAPVAGGATPPAEPAAPTELWKQTKPAAKDVNQTAMTDLLNSLSSLKATSFTTKPMGSGEQTVVVARYGEPASATDERVTFIKSGDVVQAVRSTEPGAAIVPTADFDKALNQLKALTATK